MIKVAIADDQALVRAGFRMLIDSEADLTVVAEAANGAEAVAAVRSSKPDVVLMDVRMPEMDGIEATRQIAQGPAGGAKILILTTFDLDEYVFTALRAGASGFLLKDTPPAQLLDAVRVIAAGEALLAPSVTRSLIEEFARAAPLSNRTSDQALTQLTEREREVLGLIAQGLSNAEIAERILVGAATVKTHVSRLLFKLEARDRAQLVMHAYESGLVVPHPRQGTDA